MKDLFYNRTCSLDGLDEETYAQIDMFSQNYKTFLDYGKTERDCVSYFEKEAISQGFVELKKGMDLPAGSKVYMINRDKSIILAVIGQEPICDGINLIAGHIDAPRIDIRTVPLYEDAGMGFLKTHYYGGIKKYQWLAIPLELRGVFAYYEGDNIVSKRVCIGSEPEDPVFLITDLLPHLASEQMQKPVKDAFKPENMNVLLGSAPSTEVEEDKVKYNILKILNAKYGVTEKNFLSADLTVVPAFKARDVGIDRSMIGGYGHDDRVCSYSAASAMFSLNGSVKRTSVCILMDKEEIGSEGVTSMQSTFFDRFVKIICDSQGVDLYDCYSNSMCLSADVINAFDPNYPDVSEKRNDARLNFGVAITKYTGVRGKSGASEASAELMAEIIKIFEDYKVCYQTGQLGAVDVGGGGTVASYIANRNISTVDCGVPILCMHSPFEVISKADLYNMYCAYLAFYIER